MTTSNSKQQQNNDAVYDSVAALQPADVVGDNSIYTMPPAASLATDQYTSVAALSIRNGDNDDDDENNPYIGVDAPFDL
jgi:hypothetical protein